MNWCVGQERAPAAFHEREKSQRLPLFTREEPYAVKAEKKSGRLIASNSVN